MNRLLFCLLMFAVFVMLQSCATAKKTVMRHDPLIDRIINAKTGQTVDFNTLIKNITSYDVIYLSEKHDNPEHHNIQQKIIHELIKNNIEATIGFEFFSMDNTPDLLNFMDAGKVEHSKKIEKIIEADLRRKLGWDSQSDQMWKYYFDLLKIAQKEKLEVAGIDLANNLVKRITRKGITGISPIEKEMIFTTNMSDKIYKDYMYSIFKAVHCGMGNDKMQSKLYDAWTARNDKMALSITQLVKHSNGPVVIIMGGGHTEYGLGVINRVQAIDKTISQINIASQEISTNPADLSEYLEPLELEGFGPVPPADFIWFTQRVSYKDPCIEFKKSLKKMKIHQKAEKEKS
ncbi:ChaN family lipoprotein [Desulfobacterales bacterium HSG17]|nr:ChaN family lipoprotein [Desulfobacterales bacterium HSG17]